MIKRTSVILATILMANLPVVAFEAFGVAEGEPVGGFVESAGVLFGVVEASGEPPPLFSPSAPVQGRLQGHPASKTGEELKAEGK